MSDKLFEISIVVPVYNEEESLPELLSLIEQVVFEKKLITEVILVDDGSTDRSWEVISKIVTHNVKIVALRFNRNYGKSYALDAGFQTANGRVIITMDADLQDSPEEIPALYDMIINEGFHMVSGWKKKRYDPLGKTIPSRFFNFVTRKASGIHLHDFNCGLKAYHYSVAKSLHLYGEMHRYIPLLAKWNGYKKIGEKVVKHNPRKYGVTKFGWERYVNGFLDLLSVSFVTRFRKKPMHFFGSLGSLSFLGGGGIASYLIFEKLYQQYHHMPVRDVVDQPLFFLSLVAIIVGTQLFLAGFLAELIIQVSPTKRDYLVSEEYTSE